jgi:hypothetical protein
MLHARYVLLIAPLVCYRRRAGACAPPALPRAMPRATSAFICFLPLNPEGKLLGWIRADAEVSLLSHALG